MHVVNTSKLTPHSHRHSERSRGISLRFVSYERKDRRLRCAPGDASAGVKMKYFTRRTSSSIGGERDEGDGVAEALEAAGQAAAHRGFVAFVEPVAAGLLVGGPVAQQAVGA